MSNVRPVMNDMARMSRIWLFFLSNILRNEVLKSLPINDFSSLNLYITPLEAYGCYLLAEGDGIEVN
jgi:hypothetical protein